MENAVAQSAVLGKEEPAEDDADVSDASGNKSSRFHFGGDEEEGTEPEDKVLDLRNDPLPEEEQDEPEGEDDPDGGPEDDFNAAWEVLDLARAFYEKMDGEESQLKLADTYVALGDVSLETGVYAFALLTSRSTLTHSCRKIRPSYH